MRGKYLAITATNIPYSDGATKSSHSNTTFNLRAGTIARTVRKKQIQQPPFLAGAANSPSTAEPLGFEDFWCYNAT